VFTIIHCYTHMKTTTGVLLAMACVFSASAQIGSGWREENYREMLNPEIKDKLYAIQPVPQIYHSIGCSYTNADGVQTFSLLNKNSNRIEIRVYNDYKQGQHQFAGDVRIFPPLNDECLMQIFGNTTHATLFMLRGWSDNGGSLKHYGEDTLATNAFTDWVHVNVINDRDNHITQVYINGALKGQWADTDDSRNYFKYGCYGTMRTGHAEVQWKNVKFFVK